MAELARVGLLVTCLVDLFRPSVGFAAVKLLEDAGCTVEVPRQQTCCGQPAYNSGDKNDAKAIARQVIAAFAGYDYVVVPSGSCAGMVRVHYPELFADEPATRAQAEELAARTYELVSFLVDVRGSKKAAALCAQTVTYHDSCHLAHGLGIRETPRALLRSIPGVRLVEMSDSDLCCGSAGSYNLTEPAMARELVRRKADNIEATGAEYVVLGNPGCELQIAAELRRRGARIRVIHLADFLALATESAPEVAPTD